jgi:hypothetical protein
VSDVDHRGSHAEPVAARRFRLGAGTVRRSPNERPPAAERVPKGPDLLATAPFRGTEATASGAVTKSALRGPGMRRLFRDVYVPSFVPLTHELRCRAAALLAPPGAVLTGRSAATVCGVPLAEPDDPVELLVGDGSRFGPVRGMTIRRTRVPPSDRVPWCRLDLAGPERMAFDLAAGADLVEAVVNLDATLHSRLVDPFRLADWLRRHHLPGIIRARKAASLTDPRSSSPEESRLRVLLLLAGLRPCPRFAVEHAGVELGTVDLAFPDERVAVVRGGEARRPRQGRAGFDALQAAGWRVVLAGEDQLRGDGGEIVERVIGALERTDLAVAMTVRDEDLAPTRRRHAMA